MSNANIIQLNISDEQLIDRAIEQREEGDIDGALSNLLSLEKNGCKIIEIYAQIASCYMEINLYVYAIKYWFKLLAHSPKTRQSRAFNGLGACYYYLEHYAISGYYFERQISTGGDREHEYDYVLLDYYESMCDLEKPEFSICYPSEFADYKRVLQKGDELFFARHYDEAIAQLSLVPESNENYSIAQAKISACKYFADDTDGAIDTINRLIERDNTDKVGILNMLGLLITSQRQDQAMPYFEMAEKLDLDGFESLKLATAYCDCGIHDRAKYYLSKTLDEDPYDVNSIFLYALTCYNLKEFDEALDNFALSYRITLSPSSKYYIALCKSVLSGEREFKPLAYTYTIPSEEVRRRTDFFNDLIKGGKKAIAKADKKVLFEYLEWLFSADNSHQEIMAEVLLENPSLQIRKFFLEILLDPNINDEIKSAIIEKLVENNYNKTIGVVFGDMYSKLQLLRADFDMGKNEIFGKAYALAFSKVAPIDNEKSYKIRDGAYELYYALEENGNLRKVSNIKALAGAITVYSGLKLTKNKSAIAGYFSVDVEEIKKILSLARE